VAVVEVFLDEHMTTGIGVARQFCDLPFDGFLPASAHRCSHVECRPDEIFRIISRTVWKTIP
jgi:hypothetical protein